MTGWVKYGAGPAELLGVHAWSKSSAVAVGRGGVVRLWNDRAWTASVSNTTEDLYAVWGVEPDRYFAVGGDLDVGGQSKVVEVVDGQPTVVLSGLQSILLDVCGGREGIRAVGFNGGIVERTAGGWREIDAGTNVHLFGLGHSSDSWFVAGLHGCLRESSDDEWKTHSHTSKHLSALDASEELVVAVGYRGTVVWRRAGSWRSTTIGSENMLSVAVCGNEAIAGDAAGSVFILGDEDWQPWGEIGFAVNGLALVHDAAFAVGPSATAVRER